MNRTAPRRPLPLAVLLCLAALVAGCGMKPPPMDHSEFRWQCNFAGTEGSGSGGDDGGGFYGRMGCDPFYQEQVCQEYSTRLEAFSGGLQECLSLCAATGDQLSTDRVYHDDCQGVTVEIATICTRYCRRNFQ